mgnify:CR=1 FL=1
MATRVIFILLLLLSIPTSVLHSQDISQIENIENQADGQLANHKTANALSNYYRVAQWYWNKQDFDNAIRVFNIILEINKKEGNTIASRQISNNLGLLYSNVGDYAKSLNSFLYSLEISKKQKNTKEIAASLINIASILQTSGNYDASFAYLNEALPKVIESGDLKMLRRTYGLIAQYHEKNGDSQKAFEYFGHYNAIDKKIKSSEMETMRMDASSKVYAANKEIRTTKVKLRETSSQLRATEDSLKEIERVAKDRQMQIELRNIQLREKESQILYGQKVRQTLMIGIVAMCAFLVIVFILLLDRMKANKLLNFKNWEIENQKNEISNQKEKLELQNKNITSSISYAQTIQSAALPDFKLLKEHLDISLLYRPKDIVSGDFYWHYQISKNEFIVAVVDCTGHGVPGAFMSLIGVQLLNEIVLANRVFSPGQILSQLNKLLHKALKQDITENEDGMDACICNINTGNDDTFNVSFAGAKRPLYKFNAIKNEIEVFEGASFSTGGRYFKKENVSYTEHLLTLDKGDFLVLTSDGAIDQPGPNRKRYGSNRFIDALKKGALLFNKSDEIVNYLTVDYDSYTQGEEQRDDLTVLVLKR